MKQNFKLILYIIALLFLGIPIAIIITIGLLKLLLWIYPWKPLFFIDTKGFIFELKDIVYFSMSLIGVIATGFFSYFIWKANRKSADLSEQLAKLEENRDVSTIKESASLLYFSALSAMEYILDTHRNNKTKKLLYLTDNWLDQLSHLVNQLDIEEIKRLFDMFNNINKIDQSRGMIDIFIKTYFDDSCIEYSFFAVVEYDNPIKLLKPEYKNIYNKLILLLNSGDITKYEEPQIIIERYRNGRTFFKFDIIDRHIIHKTFWDVDGNLLEDCSYENGQATGYKKIYNGNELAFDGQIKNNKMFTGKEYKILVRDSGGYDLVLEEAIDEAWIEQQLEEQNSQEYWENEAERISSMMEEGTLAWGEYCSADWLEGKRNLLTEEIYKEPLF